MLKPLIRITAIFLLLVIVEFNWLHVLLPLENRLADFFVRHHAQELAQDSDLK